MNNVRFLLTGDTSLSVEFGSEISESINHDIRAYKIALEKADIPGIVELVPTYRSPEEVNSEAIGRHKETVTA